MRETWAKQPDGLVRAAPTARGYVDGTKIPDWVEVESSYKPGDQLENVLELAWHLGGEIGAWTLDRLVIVYDVAERHEARIKRTARRLAREHRTRDNDAVFASVDLPRCTLAVPLALRAVETVTLLEVLRT